MARRGKIGGRILKAVPPELSANKREAQVPEKLKSTVENTTASISAKRVEPKVVKKTASNEKFKNTYSIEIALSPTQAMISKLEEISEIYQEPINQILVIMMKKYHGVFRSMVQNNSLKELEPVVGEINSSLVTSKARNYRVTDQEINMAQGIIDPLNLKSRAHSLSEIYLRIMQKELGL